MPINIVVCALHAWQSMTNESASLLHAKPVCREHIDLRCICQKGDSA